MQALIKASLRYYRTILALLTLFFVTGILAFITIPKESTPDIKIPVAYVSVSYDGVSPEDAERLILRPLEKELKSLSGVDKMNSTAYQGGANIVLRFIAGGDVDQALIDVREKVDRAKSDLPTEAEEPVVSEVNLSTDTPVISVSLSGSVSLRVLQKVAYDLQDEFEGLGEVLEADVVGDRDEVLEIIVDPNTLETYNLDLTQVVSLVSRNNALVAAGNLDTGTGRYGIKVPGLYEDYNDLLETVIREKDGVTLLLRDVAQVRRTFKDPTSFSRVNEEDSLTILVKKRTGENLIETVGKVKAIIEEARQIIPKGIEISVQQDGSIEIVTMLSDLGNNVFFSVLLVMIVVVAILGLRTGLLVGVAIPGSYVIGILFLMTVNATMNTVVLFALILASGMLVDGAVVITEYANRKIKQGHSRFEAYQQAAIRMSWPIIASTATTLAAFAPLAFWPGVIGEFMKFLPLTLLATLFASLLMALIFIPVLGVHLGAYLRFVFILLGGLLGIKIGGGSLSLPLAALLGAGVGYLFSRLVIPVIEASEEQPEEGLAQESTSEEDYLDPDKLHSFTYFYYRVLSVVILHPFKVVITGICVLILSIGLFAKFNKGVVLFPSVESSLINVSIHARGNLSLIEQDKLVRQVETEIYAMQREDHEFHAITVNSTLATEGDQIGGIDIELIDWFKRQNSEGIRNEIRERTSKIGGITVRVSEPETGPPTGRQFQLNLSTRTPSLLDESARHVLTGMKEVGGFIDLDDGFPLPSIDWELEVDREEAARYGADIQLIGSYIRAVTNGFVMTTYRPEGVDDAVDIILRFPEEYRSLEQLDQLRIETSKGLVPIANFVTRSPKRKTTTLERSQGFRIHKIEASVDPTLGVPPLEKVAAVRKWLVENPLPDSVQAEFLGGQERQQESMVFLMKAFGVALFIMAMILVTQFNSFYYAGLILFAVLMSTSGVFLGMLITGETFSIVMGGVGIVALAGIVVNNNIVLIDTYQHLRERYGPKDAIIQTGVQRLRPVMLTTVTTILGLIPMSLGLNLNFFTRVAQIGAPSGQWWKQLSLTIIFGLAFATLLTLLITPAALMIQSHLTGTFSSNKGKPKRGKGRFGSFKKGKVS